MPEPDSGFLLKVLSGVQFGVEVALDEGSYSFGSGADADVQIVDVTLAPIHGHLRIRGGKLALRADGGEIGTSSGLTIPAGQADWHEVAQLDIITAGTTRFAVGGRGAKWAALARSEGTGGAAPARAATGGNRAARSGRGIGLAAAGVLAAIGLTAAGLYFGGGATPILSATQVDEVAPVEIVQRALAALPFEHAVHAVAAVDGTLDAEGYVQTTVERRAVLNALNDTRLQVRRRIWVRDIIENEVAELIRSQNLPVSQTLSRDGVLTLSGDVLDPAQAARITGLIRGEVFGLASVQDNIRTAEHYLTEVRGVIESARLRDRVILRLDGMLIEATGVVTTDQIDNWVGFIQVYSRRYAPILPLRSFVTLETAAGAEVGAPIVIGSAAPGQGRVVPPEALSTDSIPQVRDIFALPPAALSAAEGGAPPADPAGPPPGGQALAGAGTGLPGAPGPNAPGADTPPDAAAPPPGQPPAPATATAAVSPQARQAVQAAAAQLADTRPDLAERMLASQAAGEAPPLALIQEVLSVIGGRMVLRAGLGGIEPMVILPGADAPLSYNDILGALTNPPPDDPETAAPVTAPAPVIPPATDRALLLRSLLEGASVALPAPPEGAPAPPDAPAPGIAEPGTPGTEPDADAPAPVLASTGTGLGALLAAGPGASGAGDAPLPVSTAPPANGAAPAPAPPPEPGPTAGTAPDAPAEPATAEGDPALAAPGPDPRPMAAAPDTLLASRADTDPAAAQPPAAAPPPETPAGTAPATPPRRNLSFGEYQGFYLESRLTPAMGRMVLAGERLIGLQDSVEGGVVVLPAAEDGGVSILDMAKLQNEAIAAGATLLPSPGPLGAAPLQNWRTDTCWPGSRVQIPALATLLMWLDILSLNAELDLADVDQIVQIVLMEAALSPDRLRDCLNLVNTDFARRLRDTSAFLAESARNDDFGRFLFRNVPAFDIQITGASLVQDRFLQTGDGRRLRAGMAPTLNSRLAVIGDLGALFRVEGGYQVLLYPDSLSWRIAGN